MRIDPNTIQIVKATPEHANDWTKVFLKGMNNFRWMTRYLKESNISDIDVSLSFTEDIKQKAKGDKFLIAYVSNIPVGIIRFEDYWLSKSTKILSHFPLVIPRFQRKGIGTILVKEGAKELRESGYKNIWAECWSKDMREIVIYRKFYEKIKFVLKSNRLEMSCYLPNFNGNNIQERQTVEIVTNNKLTNDFIVALSKSYAISKDKLHIIEELGNQNTCKEFLLKTKDTFEKAGFTINCNVAKYKREICASIMTATSKHKGLILEIGVMPEFRKMNIAQTLIIEFLEKMKNKGILEVVLGVDADNLPAINLYKKLSFKKTWSGIMLLLENIQKLES